MTIINSNDRSSNIEYLAKNQELDPENVREQFLSNERLEESLKFMYRNADQRGYPELPNVVVGSPEGHKQQPEEEQKKTKEEDEADKAKQIKKRAEKLGSQKTLLWVAILLLACFVCACGSIIFMYYLKVFCNILVGAG